MRSRKLDRMVVEGMELVELYRTDPVLAAMDLLNVDLPPAQRIILRDLWEKNFVILVAGRGCGKTYLQAVVAVLSCLLYPSYRVGLLGPSFRQAKHIFMEIERLWDRSAIFRAACAKKPTRGPDSCYVKFRGTGAPGSFIEALPLGADGSKIRGSRFFTICTDEFAQVPEKLFNTVIKPMGATVRDPMENVRRIERQKRLLERGLIDEVEESAVNKVFMTSSGYYKFNHMWKRMKFYWHKIREGDDSYAVHQISYRDMPEGFINMATVEESRQSMSLAEFQTEWEGLMVSDTDGAFKASLLESCSKDTGFTIQPHGEKAKSYILGVDVASKQDAFAITIVELGSPNKIVNVIEKTKLSFPAMARIVYDMCDRYNVVRIFMDRFGGGESLKDILSLGLDGNEPLLDRDDKDSLFKHGRRILELCTPSSQWIEDANFGTKALLEKKELLFPMPPQGLDYGSQVNVEQADAFDNIKKMKSQILSIVITETPSGRALHFNTPAKGQAKDLYSSFVLAGWGVIKLAKELEEEETPILYHGGLVSPRNVDGTELVSPTTGRPFIHRNYK